MHMLPVQMEVVMVATDRFLEGLFAPHGGLMLTLPKPDNVIIRFSDWLQAAISRILKELSRPFRRSDYALCN